MITFKSIGKYGRLGNQMFQYAALLGAAKIKNFKYGVNYGNKSNNQFAHFILPDIFQYLDAEDCNNYDHKYSFIEPHWHFSEKLFEIQDNTDIIGYFQSEKYFKHIKKEILKQFTFKDEIFESALKKRKEISSPVISLHIRLGDYKQHPDIHPICSIEYYKQALEILPKDLPIFIFSDEHQTALQLFSELNREIKIVTNLGNADMCLMTMCDYHIIANSSFSWWGAWMSNSNKVIAPKKWFGTAPTAPKYWDTVYCDGWVVLE